MGPLGWLAPLVALGTAIVGGWAAALGDGPADHWRQLFLVGLEGLLPLAVASAAVTIVARDPFREVHLAVPTQYRATLLRRLAVLCGYAVTATVPYTVGLVLTDCWSGPTAWAAPLVWLPPMLWLTGFALVVGLAAGSVAVGSGLASGLWIAEQLCMSHLEGISWVRPLLLFFTSRIGTGQGWLANRVTVTGTGLALIVVAVVLMRGGERWMTEEEV